MSNGNGKDTKPRDPFAMGVWILCLQGGCKSLVLLVDTESRNTPELQAEAEAGLRAELFEHGFLRISAKRKFTLAHVIFPTPKVNAQREIVGFDPMELKCVTKYESGYDLEFEFMTHSAIFEVSFLSDLQPSDVERMRVNVRNAEEIQARNERARRSNIIMPGSERTI